MTKLLTCANCGRLHKWGGGELWCPECEAKRPVTHADPRHDTPVRVTLLDTATGETRPDEWSFGTYWWTEGNGSCDCNRRIVFGHDGDECVSVRYRVVAVEPMLKGHTLADFNRNYE